MYRALVCMFFVCLLAYWSNEEAVNSEVNYTQYDTRLVHGPYFSNSWFFRVYVSGCGVFTFL